MGRSCTIPYLKERYGMKIRFGKDRVSLRRYLGLKRDSDPAPPFYSHIDQFQPEDVFVVGFPKSGNTWFQNLISGVVHGVDARFSPPLLANDLVPDVHFNTFYRRYGTPMFFKSHYLPREGYRQVVYLLRDGRDVMVSCLHYLEAIRRQNPDFLDLVTNRAPEFLCKWHEHVDAWLANPHGARMLIIRYEDLVENPVAQLERFCGFINLSRERRHLENVAEATLFRNLRAKEARVGIGRPDTWPADKFFFRRGIVGSYRDEMPPEIMRAFLREAEPTLRRVGYLPQEARSEEAIFSSRFSALIEPLPAHYPGPMPAK